MSWKTNGNFSVVLLAFPSFRGEVFFSGIQVHFCKQFWKFVTQIKDHCELYLTLATPKKSFQLDIHKLHRMMAYEGQNLNSIHNFVVMQTKIIIIFKSFNHFLIKRISGCPDCGFQILGIRFCRFKSFRFKILTKMIFGKAQINLGLSRFV